MTPPTLRRLAGGNTARSFDPSTRLGSRVDAHTRRDKPWEAGPPVRMCGHDENGDPWTVVMPGMSVAEATEIAARLEGER